MSRVGTGGQDLALHTAEVLEVELSRTQSAKELVAKLVLLKPINSPGLCAPASWKFTIA